MSKSQKELALERKILRLLEGKVITTAELLFKDREIQQLQDYANTVSIKRLGYNDHGPVHMKKVVLNSMIMVRLLTDKGIKLTLEEEEIGSLEESTMAILIAAYLHDIGMSVGRDKHENASAILAMPIIDRVLKSVYPQSPEKPVIIRSLIIEGILGHMATQQIHSLEAGIILIADGCDMEKGRARIPMLISTESKVGDIHQYSAASIEKVIIEKGGNRPIKITVTMNDSVGFFQIEEVLFKKINSSPVKEFIELFAGVIGKEMKCYL